jgi:hypothetical protein
MRRYGEISRGAERSSPRQFFLDCTIAMCGYDFREGHPQNAIAQSFGIAFTGFRKCNDPFSDCFMDKDLSMSESKRHQGHFEPDARDSDGLRIEPVAVQVWPDRHDVRAPPSHRST